MEFSICCCCKSTKPTKEPTGSNSPNVIDVYIDAFNKFEPITTQPHAVQRKPRPLSDGLVHDLKKYKNDPKGFNNFAFVDEIDFGKKSKNVIEQLDCNKIQENLNQSIKDVPEKEIHKKSILTNNVALVENVAKESVIESYESYVSLNTMSNRNSMDSSNCTIKNGQKNVEIYDIENRNTIQNANIVIDNNVYVDESSIYNDVSSYFNNFLTTSSAYSVAKQNKSTVTITENGQTRTYDIEDSPYYNKNENCIQIGNVTINNSGKILIDSIKNSHISNNKNLHTINENNIIKNAFQNFIETSGLVPHVENLHYHSPIESYANIKKQDEYLMTAIEIPRKIPKRKFPYAFDKRIEKATDLKRKPPTNLIISKVQLLKELPSDYSYATFRLTSLNVHNKLRAKHDCPPLVESDELNEIAKDWADHLAINNYEIYHRPNNKFGENLYWTSNPFGNAKMAVEAWYNEIELYDYNNPGFSQETGHFTQLLWKDTKELGTAFAKIGNTLWVVCNYNPPGNVQGKFNDSHVPRPIK